MHRDSQQGGTDARSGSRTATDSISVENNDRSGATVPGTRAGAASHPNCDEDMETLFGGTTFHSDHRPSVAAIRRDLKNRHVRWAMQFAEFDFDIKYMKGESNVVADTLSRGAAGETEGERHILTEIRESDGDQRWNPTQSAGGTTGSGSEI
jgi:hypothetical protein